MEVLRAESVSLRTASLRTRYPLDRSRGCFASCGPLRQTGALPLGLQPRRYAPKWLRYRSRTPLPLGSLALTNRAQPSVSSAAGLRVVSCSS
jgi:hypothetical protein